MSSFQFNFELKSASSVASSSNDKIQEKQEREKEHEEFNMSCEEWKVPRESFLKSINEFESEAVEGFSGNLLKRKYSNVLFDLKNEKSNEILKITKESDLEPNKYEGGLKTWECSIDLLNYLSEEPETAEYRNVLEIGCGSGLPGIFCYKQFESKAEKEDDGGLFVFQDFNQSVLERVTLPNLILNSIDPSLLYKRTKFFFGDWKGFPSKLVEERVVGSFDLILTCETIYRQESYGPLLEIFSQALSSNPEARVLLAAKDYYFGLGGSVQEFHKFVLRSGGGDCWKIKTLRQFTEGVPRTILEIKRR